MKLTKKVPLIIAIAFAAVGILLAAVSVVMVHGDFRLLSTTTPYVEKTYSVNADTVHTVILNTYDQKVQIVKSADNQIHLDYFDRDKEQYTISSSNGELLIDLTRNMKWFDYIGIDFYGGVTFKIAVPDDMVCDFSLSTSNGQITMDNLSEKGNLALTTSNGNIVLTDVTTTGSLKSGTSNGYIGMSNLSAAGPIEASTSNSNISANGVSASGISMHSSNGKLNLSNMNSKKDIDIGTSNSNIQFSNISVATLFKIRSSNGSINGDINDTMKDFTVISHTSNGNDNLPESLAGGSKSLDVKTSNGNINVSFSGR